MLQHRRGDCRGKAPMTIKPKPRKAARPRGRPVYKPSIEGRQTVEEMKYFGEDEAVIARALGIDIKTLKKHFADELDGGFAARRKEIVGMLFKSAREGNVSAQRKLEEIGKVAGAAEEVDRRTSQPPVPPAPPKLGKKEEANVRAVDANVRFAVPTPPKLVVDNRR